MRRVSSRSNAPRRLTRGKFDRRGTKVEDLYVCDRCIYQRMRAENKSKFGKCANASVISHSLTTSKFLSLQNLAHFNAQLCQKHVVRARTVSFNVIECYRYVNIMRVELHHQAMCGFAEMFLPPLLQCNALCDCHVSVLNFQTRQHAVRCCVLNCR